MRKRVAPALLALAMIPALEAAGDPLTAGKSTVDGGGVSFVTAGSFRLGATIGQHDAGSLIWLPYVIVGGFWGGTVGATVSVDDPPPGDLPGPQPGPAPLHLRIHRVQPNPTHAGASVELELPRPLPARARLYDVRGARVRDLIDRELPAGRHRLSWDGRDDAGQRLAAGLYVLRIELGELRSAQKVMVMR